jgi:hypothetical protein
VKSCRVVECGSEGLRVVTIIRLSNDFYFLLEFFLDQSLLLYITALGDECAPITLCLECSSPITSFHLGHILSGYSKNVILQEVT